MADPSPSYDTTIQLARSHADALEADMRWKPGSTGYGGYWTATHEHLTMRIVARATGALDFLERHAGADSQWTVRAHRLFENKGENQSTESGARAVAQILREWASQVEDGAIRPRTATTAGLRSIASSDLMGQVRALLAEPELTPVAPIVLAGAALEIALRSVAEELGLSLPEKQRPSITAYARLLRANDVIGVQQMKDVEQISGVRNEAAHGHLDALSRERAALIEQQVNLFLAQLEDHVQRNER